MPRGERFDLAGLAQHLVDVRGVQLLDMDHLAGEFLERDGAAFHQMQQLLVELQRGALGVEGLAQHRRDVVLVAVEQRTDGERGIGTEGGDPFAELLSVRHRFVGLRAQPGHDRNAAEAEDEERVVRVAHHAGKLGLEQPVKHLDDRFLVELGHGGSSRQRNQGQGDGPGPE